MSREQIEYAAARWLLRREEPEWDEHDQELLDAWLEESLSHQAAYWRLEEGWRLADRLGAPRHAPAIDRRLAGRPARITGVAAAAASLVIAVGLGSYWLNARTADTAGTERVATAVGGRSHVALSDGSMVELNTTTVLRTAVTSRRREVWLDRGEAYFEVKHSDRSPFVVHAGPRTVTVLGTRFSVRREGDRVTVRVVEGRVRVDETASDAASSASATVTTGDVAIAQGASTLVTRQTPDRIARSLAWREGRVVFEDTPLSVAAAEFNRYGAKRIVVADSAADIPIGGTFRASNAEAFVRLMRDAYGLTVVEGENEVRLAR